MVGRWTVLLTWFCFRGHVFFFEGGYTLNHQYSGERIRKLGTYRDRSQASTVGPSPPERFPRPLMSSATTTTIKKTTTTSWGFLRHHSKQKGKTITNQQGKKNSNNNNNNLHHLQPPTSVPPGCLFSPASIVPGHSFRGRGWRHARQIAAAPRLTGVLPVKTSVV